MNLLHMKHPILPGRIEFSTFKVHNGLFNICHTSSFIFGQHLIITSDDPFIRTCTQCVYSEYVSGPLTFHDGLQLVHLSNLLQGDICIHVIAAETIDVESLLAWELLLHLYPAIGKLTIILIGPEIKHLCSDHNVCSTCVLNERCYNYKCYSMLYDKYVRSPYYIEPTAIVGFQVEFCNFRKTWYKTIKVLSRQICPILLTAKSQYEARRDIREIEDVLETSVPPDYYCTNDFKSFKPYWDVKTDTVCYRNTVLYIYKTLLPYSANNSD
ncbi:uncharacterized protein LOC105183155 isoform X1 [Harpegnathos saltator]|uniref:uncharacterized protein LOC105183155 isoform X1 n=1 Tax=Harpegnathos saltator TaxID=610380 RepID=UPI00058B726D|nr:uncharacterized protein LOC105183155 isoform X1 [Harpegnathos saltator]